MTPPGRLGSSTRAEAYRAIRDAIIDGRLPPGELVREEQLAKQINVSRTPIREALVALESEGLVTASGRRLQVKMFSAKEITDIYDARALIESQVASVLATTIQQYDLAVLDDIQAEFRKAFQAAQDDDADASLEARREALRANRLFHVRIVESTGNSALTAILTRIIETPLPYHAVMWYDLDQLGRSVAEHDEMLQALRDGDADAARRCWFAHIEEGKFTLLANLERHARQYYGPGELQQPLRPSPPAGASRA